MIEEPKVSFVVPVYNVEKKLVKRCVESILKQTDKSFEIILVDDGSREETADYCDKIVRWDPRMQVVHQENAGLSAARNTGVRNAIGEYITFVDSDDWVDANFIETLYGHSDAGNADVVIGKMTKDYKHKIIENSYPFSDFEEFLEKDRVVLLEKVLDFHANIFDAPGKLIKRKFLDINNIEHNSDLSHGAEGVEFNFRLFSQIQNCIFCDSFIYHYVNNDNSITKAPVFQNDLLALRCFKAIQTKIEELQISNTGRKKLQLALQTRILFVLASALISTIFHPNNTDYFEIKRKNILMLREDSIIKLALRFGSRREIGLARRLVIYCFEHSIYLPIKVIAYLRYQQNQL